MTVGELPEKHLEVFGEETHSYFREFLRHERVLCHRLIPVNCYWLILKVHYYSDNWPAASPGTIVEKKGHAGVVSENSVVWSLPAFPIAALHHHFPSKR